MPNSESNNPLAHIVEAMLTVGEIRRPGYVKKVMAQLQGKEATVVAELHPDAGDEKANTRASAVQWLQQASIRARAKAAEKQARKRETR